MKKVFEEPTVLPRHGYISELAGLCHCNRKTVTRALFEGQTGKKSDLVREMYKRKYIQHAALLKQNTSKP